MITICYDCIETKECFKDDDGQKRCHDCYGKKYNKRRHNRAKQYHNDEEKPVSFNDLKRKWERK